MTFYIWLAHTKEICRERVNAVYSKHYCSQSTMKMFKPKNEFNLTHMQGMLMMSLMKLCDQIVQLFGFLPQITQLSFHHFKQARLWSFFFLFFISFLSILHLSFNSLLFIFFSCKINFKK